MKKNKLKKFKHHRRKPLNPKRESRPKLVIYTITMLLTMIYITYRIFFTLPFRYGKFNVICGIIVLLLEFTETIDFIIYYFNILCFNKKSYKVPTIKNEEYPDVDVFIATINESKKLLEETIKACLHMKYPKKKKVHIYICDDGNRIEIKNLAKQYNVGYITREDNTNAKAGNYNNALKHTSSPYIATFDADMRPTPDFLLTTIPFFVKSAKVGFVQLPQSFTNPDIFQLRFGLSDEIPFEQDYFYHRIQLAKNKTNSTIYCGTNAVIKREALDAIDGFALNTITEDIATGMLIEAKGYRGIALSSVQAYGNAVNDLTAFAKQRSRWGRGCIQIFKKYKILRQKGLTFRQKLDYLSAISYWFYGVRRILYLIIPLLFSLFGLMVIDCNLVVFFLLFTPQYLLKRIALDSLEDKRRSSTWNKIYEIILAPVMAKEILKELFGFGNTKFEVTPKEKLSNKMTKTNLYLLIVHLLFLIFNILGLIVTIYKITISEYTYIFILPLIWLLTNIFYLLVAVIFDLRIRPVYYENFIPNYVEQYSIDSLFSIFSSISKKKMPKE